MHRSLGFDNDFEILHLDRDLERDLALVDAEVDVVDDDEYLRFRFRFVEDEFEDDELEEEVEWRLRFRETDRDLE